jgi:tetratricopeptide (TPR) repeat protein
MNDAPRALNAFQQALDLNTPKLDLLAKTYSQMGYLFMYQGLHDEVIRVNRKAIELYLSQGKRNKISYALRDIARMYSVKNMQDSALYYYKEACQTTLTDRDSTRYYGILGELGGYYYKLGRFDEAQKTLSKAEKKSEQNNKAHIYINLGNIYEKKQKWDSAYHYYKKVLTLGDIYQKCYTYYDLGWMESRKGNHSKAMEYMKQYVLLKDSIDYMKETETVAKINALYNYQHTEEENAKLELEKEKQRYWNLIFCTSSVCIIILSGTFILYQKRKKENLLSRIEEKRKQDEQKYNSSLEAIRNNQQKIAKLEKSLKEKKTENNQLQQKLAEIEKEKLKAQNEVIKQWNEEQKLRLAAFRESEIYRELLQASKDETFNMTPIKHPNKWMAIQENINSIYPGFTERLCKLCPSLSDKDLQVCYLTKMGMSPSDISRVLQQSRQAITNTRKRIMQKMGSLMAEKSNFDDFIEEF